MQNRFIKNIIFLLFLNLLVKPFWILGIDREVQNLLGDASYGTYQALFNFSYLFYILLDLGITNFNSRAVAQDPKTSRSTLAASPKSSSYWVCSMLPSSSWSVTSAATTKD